MLFRSLGQRKDAVSDFLQRRLHEALLPLELCADGRGEWFLMLPVSSDLAEATVIAVSSWAEESMLVDMLAKAMGRVMRLSSALGHLLVRLALDGDLSTYALRCALLSFFSRSLSVSLSHALPLSTSLFLSLSSCLSLSFSVTLSFSLSRSLSPSLPASLFSLPPSPFSPFSPSVTLTLVFPLCVICSLLYILSVLFISLSLSLSLSLSHVHTHTHTLTRICVSLSLSLSHTHTHLCILSCAICSLFSRCSRSVVL